MGGCVRARFCLCVCAHSIVLFNGSRFQCCHLFCQCFLIEQLRENKNSHDLFLVLSLSRHLNFDGLVYAMQLILAHNCAPWCVYVVFSVRSLSGTRRRYRNCGVNALIRTVSRTQLCTRAYTTTSSAKSNERREKKKPEVFFFFSRLVCRTKNGVK